MSGSLKFLYDTTTTPVAFIPNGTLATLVLPPAGSADNYMGTAKLKNFKVTNPATDLVTVSVDFSGSGALTLPS